MVASVDGVRLAGFEHHTAVKIPLTPLFSKKEEGSTFYELFWPKATWYWLAQSGRMKTPSH